MQVHNVFFWLAAFFLVGVFFASLTTPAGAIIAAALLAAVFLYFDRRQLALLALVAILGSGYYFTFDYLEKQQLLEPEGVVVTAKQHLNYQELILDNKLKIITSRHPAYNYGDEIIAQGEIKKSRSKFIRGVMSYPKIEMIDQNKGNLIKAALIQVRLAFEDNLKKVLPQEKAAFLSGLTVGSTGEISKEFNEKMKTSGTSHLVALSGYNVSIIAGTIGWLLGFWPTMAVIILFVIMTGAEASLVRAAIMGVVLLLSQRIERVSSPRNTLTAAALLMVLWDPQVLTFDLGFQLSFLATIGILYLKPLFNNDGNKIFDGFLTNISAQIMVLPLLVIKFGGLNLLRSIPANSFLTVLPFISYTMAFGFAAGVAGFIFEPLALILAWFANIFLTYEMAIIGVFAGG